MFDILAIRREWLGRSHHLKLVLGGVLTVVGLFGLPSHSQATFTVDLTFANAKDDTNANGTGALFFQQAPQSTGTGFIDPFLRLQANKTESGYNTDGTLEFDTKASPHTHSLALSVLDVINIGGTNYYKFALDINQSIDPASGKGLLAMTDLKIFLGDAPDLTGYSNGFGSHSSLVYDLDGGANGDGTVYMAAGLTHGSGSGDANVYIPVSFFQGKPANQTWVYLYSAFGIKDTQYESTDGFEEWWTQSNVLQPVPAPPAAILFGLGFAGVGLAGLRRRLWAKAA